MINNKVYLKISLNLKMGPSDSHSIAFIPKNFKIYLFIYLSWETLARRIFPGPNAPWNIRPWHGTFYDGC